MPVNLPEITVTPMARGPNYDPFKRGSLRAAMHRKAAWRVTIGGRDISNKLDPYLLSIRVQDRLNNMEANIEVDDRDGRLDLPPINTPMQVEIGWEGGTIAKVFDGYTDGVEYSLNRDSGRQMVVHAHGFNSVIKIKSPFMQYLGAGAPPGKDIGMPIPFIKMATKVAKAGDSIVAIHPKLAAMTKDYWGQVNESAMHWMNRVSRELGGVSRVIAGNLFQVTIPGEDTSGGKTTITARWNDNIISLRVHPLAARSFWQKAGSAWYSQLAGQWKSMVQSLGVNMPFNFSDAIGMLPLPAPNSMGAANQAGGMDTGNSSESGKIVIDGDPQATSMGGHVMVEGVRPGVDGDYIIEEVEHVYARDTGYLCNLTVHVDMAAQTSTNVGTSYNPQPQNINPKAPAPTPGSEAWNNPTKPGTLY